MRSVQREIRTSEVNPVGFERERKLNLIAMAVGVILAAAGFILYFFVSGAGGILFMIAGVAILVITVTISGVFYKVDMIELLENRKKTN
jgi:fatty acid desaturase